MHGDDSNRRVAADAMPQTVERIRAELRALNPRAAGRVVDATPRNSLRIPFLDALFPDASFVYVYREPRETIASMIEAWRSGEYVTYPSLRGWPGPPWSLLLVPGWRDLAGRPLAEIAATQWATTTRVLLDDLEQLPPERWCVADFAALVSDGEGQLRRLAEFLGLEWQANGAAQDPRSHVELAGEAAAAQHAEAVRPVLQPLLGLAERARDLLAEPTSRRPTATPDADSPLRSVYPGALPRILDRLGLSLLATAPASGKLICVRREGVRVNTHFRDLPRPRAVAATTGGLAVATPAEVWRYREASESPSGADETSLVDTRFVPLGRHFTGAAGIAELAFAAGELWAVCSRFSCLATLDGEHSFVPRWTPGFISEVAGDDRCHVSGLALRDDRPAFATALGSGDEPGEWRKGRMDGGCVVDVESGEIAAAGLCLPHSPRWHDGRLWVLESGKGALCTVDPASGETEVVVELPGFARGLAFAGGLAFVGLSRPRLDSAYPAPPVASRFEEHFSGIWVVHPEHGTVSSYLRFQAEVPEVFGIAALSGMPFPEILEASEEPAREAFSLPASRLSTRVP